MKKFLIALGILLVPAIGILIYTYWWMYHNFDKQEEFQW